MNFRIEYGSDNFKIDITNKVLEKCLKNNIITIPSNDCIRAKLFSDPLVNVLKKIYIIDNLSNKINEYNHKETICIDIDTNRIYTTELSSSQYLSYKMLLDKIPNYLVDYAFPEVRPILRLQSIHNNLKIHHGSFSEEFPEQLMAAKYIKGYEKVLEIGANIGRNTLVIASMLQDSSNMVSLESDVDIANKLQENKDLNKLNFHIEKSALSKRNLIQKDWNTFVSDAVPEGYTKVNIISFNELVNKYRIDFDTLVLDCEGAFYYILYDMPEILNNINLIIMENDYHVKEHKEYIDNILTKNNFVVDYSQSGGWGPCYHNFFEVWIRK